MNKQISDLLGFYLNGDHYNDKSIRIYSYNGHTYSKQFYIKNREIEGENLYYHYTYK